MVKKYFFLASKAYLDYSLLSSSLSFGVDGSTLFLPHVDD